MDDQKRKMPDPGPFCPDIYVVLCFVIVLSSFVMGIVCVCLYITIVYVFVCRKQKHKDAKPARKTRVTWWAMGYKQTNMLCYPYPPPFCSCCAWACSFFFFVLVFADRPLRSGSPFVLRKKEKRIGPRKNKKKKGVYMLHSIVQEYSHPSSDKQHARIKVHGTNQHTTPLIFTTQTMSPPSLSVFFSLSLPSSAMSLKGNGLRFMLYLHLVDMHCEKVPPTP